MVGHYIAGQHMRVSRLSHRIVGQHFAGSYIAGHYDEGQHSQIVWDTVLYGIAKISMTYTIWASHICMISNGYGFATDAIHYIMSN